MSSLDLSTTGEQWFILQVVPNAVPHLRVWLGLLDLQTKVFTHERKRRRGKKTYPVPSIPGYIFVRMDPVTSRWREAIDLTGAVRFLAADGETPTPINEEDFSEFARRHDEFFRDPMSKTQAKSALTKLVKGMAGRLISGPFQGSLAVVVQDQKKDRVRVNITIFGRVNETWIDRSLLPEKL